MTYVILNWPPVELSPNNGIGARWNKTEYKNKYKNDCFYLAKATNLMFGKGAQNIPLEITFFTKTKTRPDLDNCLAWIKYGIDGVAKAWGVNDRQFYPITLNYGEPVKGGKVKIEVKA